MELHLGTLAHVTGNPHLKKGALVIIEDGALLLDGGGNIVYAGPKQDLPPGNQATVINHGQAWLLPGLVDGHIHFPQFYATAANGKELLDWLNRSIFPAEAQLAQKTYARSLARDFVAHLLAMGTTTALVFGSQFQHANEALFAEAANQGMRLIAGMTMMDRMGPDALLVSPEQARDQAELLIDLVRDEPLLNYAVTPRFAISCSPKMLKTCGDLVGAHDGIYIQTHINENHEEIKTTADMFPQAPHYLGIYDDCGLLTPRTVLAHNIHASDAEMDLLAERGSAVCHCPASNAYLGSGLFPMLRHLEREIPLLMGTDIGAGTHFSILSELGETYKVQQLQRYRLDPATLLYLGTLAGAEALHLAHKTGNFALGKQADFLVLDPTRETYLQQRLTHTNDPCDRLFVLLNMAGPQHIVRTVVAGRTVYQAAGGVSQ